MSAEIALLTIAAGAQVASGVVGYMGAQRQAEGMEQQAQQAQLLAANRAQIQRNNAIGQMQDEQFQAGVSRFNQQEALVQTDRQLQINQDKTRATLASAQAQAARRGLVGDSFDDILRSEAFLAEREEAESLYQGGQSGYQSFQQGNLAGLRGARAIEMGRYDSALSIAEGRYTSSNLRNQASATRIGGYATLLGGVAEGASTASGIWTP